MLKRILCVLTLTLLAATSVFSQVTTSNLSGIIKSKSGTSLAGASIIAVHLPTGTTYRTLSRSGGTFDLPNVTPGGPYKIDVTFVGYESTSRDNIFISLGETSQQEFVLTEAATSLEGVVVSAMRRPIQESKGGTETNIGRDKMLNLPTQVINISHIRSNRFLGRGNDADFFIVNFVDVFGEDTLNGKLPSTAQVLIYSK